MGIPEAIGLGANALGIGAGAKAAGDSGKKNAPAPPDYAGLAQQQADASRRLANEQTAANRPNQSTPFASSTWAQGPDGQWTQQVGFNGPLAGAAQSAQQQAADAMGQPLDFSGLQQMTSGEAARQQAIDAAYGQATSRLDPRFSRARDSERTRLLNQGLAEGSEAFRRAMGELGMQENDAYNQAQFSAIGQGTQAGQAIFGQNLAARQQGMSELLRKRQQPMQDLQSLQGLTAMPGFSQAGRGETPQLLNAGQQQYADTFRKWATEQGIKADTIESILQMAGQIGTVALSDERAKRDVYRLPVEAFPGVPFATWRYFYDSPSTERMGVVAQDLQRVAPQYVRMTPEGLLTVDYSFLRGGT